MEWHRLFPPSPRGRGSRSTLFVGASVFLTVNLKRSISCHSLLSAADGRQRLPQLRQRRIRSRGHEGGQSRFLAR
jgi:hypothetical protein